MSELKYGMYAHEARTQGLSVPSRVPDMAKLERPALFGFEGYLFEDGHVEVSILGGEWVWGPIRIEAGMKT